MDLIVNLPGSDLVITECRDAITFEGKSRTDKQLSVLADVTSNTLTYAATKGGKVGKFARDGMAETTILRAAHAAAKGNFTPLYEIIVLESVKHVQPIRNTRDYDMARGFIKGLRDNLRNGGYSSTGKMTSECVSLETVLRVFALCDEAIAEQKAKDAERRAAAAIEKAAAAEPVAVAA